MKHLSSIAVVLVVSLSSTLQTKAFDFQTSQSQKTGYIENKGQVIDQNRHQQKDVLYLFNDGGFSIVLRKTGFTYQFTSVQPADGSFSESGPINNDVNDDPDEIKSVPLKRTCTLTEVDFENANKNVVVDATNQIDFYYNFFTDYISVGNVHVFKKVIYHNVYNYIDLMFSFKEDDKGNMLPEYQWIIHPKGNPNDIALKYFGAKQLFVNENGSLNVVEELGYVNEAKPVILENGSTRNSKISFILQNNILTFKNAKLKSKGDYIIDPILYYAFYHIGNNLDKPDEMVFDHDVNKDYAVIAGRTISDNSFVYSGFFQDCIDKNPVSPFLCCVAPGCDYDAFIAKYDVTTTIPFPLFVTYFGGVYKEIAYSVCTDPLTHEIYIGGATISANLDYAPNGVDPLDEEFTQLHNAEGTDDDLRDGFVAKFSKDGKSKEKFTYIGGLHKDYFLGITAFVNSATGQVNIAAVGSTVSDNTTDSNNNIPKNPINGTVTQFDYSHGGNMYGDIMLELFDVNLVQIWGTYYGLIMGQERGHEITSNKAGTKLYIAGSADHTCPVEPTMVFQRCTYNNNSGNPDALLTSWNVASGTINWITYYGGRDEERGRGVRTDDAENIYLYGHVRSNCTMTGDCDAADCDDFLIHDPSTVYNICNGGADCTAGGNDVFVAKFNTQGVRIWGTAIGGNDDEEGRSLQVNPLGTKIYVGGATHSENFNPNDGQINHDNTNGTYDYFVAAFNGSAALQYYTFYGGMNDEGEGENVNGDYYQGVLTTNTTNGDIYLSCFSQSDNVSTGFTPDPFYALEETARYNMGSGQKDYMLARYTDGCLVSNATTAVISPSGNLQACSGNNISLSVTVPSGYTVQWYLNGSLISGATTGTITASADGVYRVQLSNSGCTITTPDWGAANVTHLPSSLNTCCNSPYWFTFYNTTASAFEGFIAGSRDASFINIVNHTLTGETNKISFNGTFTLDEDFTFTNCSNVTFAEDAEVDLNGHTLTLLGTTFTDCDGANMWNGIKSGPGSGTSGITSKDNSGTNSEISNARTAIDLSSSITATYIIQKTTFNNNHIDINLGSNATSSSSIYGCTFKSIPAYTLLNPYPLDRTHIGIQGTGLSNLRIGQSTTSGVGNTFNNIDKGIFLDHCTATILKNTFQNFSKNTKTSELGYAIHGILGSGTGSSYLMNVGDGTSNNQNTFLTGKYYGVYGDGVGGNINMNAFTHDDKPVTFLNSTSPISIVNNQITDASYGINLNNNGVTSGSPKIEASDNIISLLNSGVTSGRYGIYYSYTNAVVLVAEFIGNTINVNSQQFGIQLLNAKKLTVSENTINLNLTATASDGYYGISCSSVKGSTIECNNMIGNSISNGYASERGISLNISINNTIECNTTDKEFEGLEFLGACTGSTIKGNTLKYHDQGLAVGDIVGSGSSIFGDISNQNIDNGKAPGNIFYGTNGSGIFSTSALYRIIIQSEDPNPLSINYQYYTNGVLTIPLTTKSNLNGNANAIVTTGFNGISDFSCSDQSICSSSNTQGRSIEDGSDSTDTNTDSSEVVEIISAVDSINPTIDAMIWYEKQNLYETTVNDSVMQDTIPDLQVFNDTIPNNNIGLFSQIDDLMASVIYYKGINVIDSMSISKNQALNMLNLIAPQRQLEDNEKSVDEIYLATLAVGIDTFTTVQVGNLLNIANQCPFVGGNSVYQARGMYGLINDSMIYDDNEECSEIQQVKNSPPDQSSVIVKAYPNPSDQMLSLQYSLPLNKNYQFYISDLNGKAIMSVDIKGKYGEKTIDISELPAGYYTMHVNDNGSPKWRSKLIVVR